MSKIKEPLNMAKKPASKDWDRWQIIGAVRKTGTSLRALSLSLGYGPTVLRNALYHPAPKYERIIAEHLAKHLAIHAEITQQKIWPSRYHDDGSSKSGRNERGLGRYKALRKGNGVQTRESSNLPQGGV
jgi:Ner family transcriptional regulator